MLSRYVKKRLHSARQCLRKFNDPRNVNAALDNDKLPKLADLLKLYTVSVTLTYVCTEQGDRGGLIYATKQQSEALMMMNVKNFGFLTIVGALPIV